MAGFGESFGEWFGEAGVTYFRHGIRHVQQSIVEDIRLCLTQGLWFETLREDRPYGSDPLTFGTKRADEWKAESIQPNYVGVTFGDLPDVEPLELGGGLRQHDVPVFVDVYGQDEARGTAIAADIADWFRGENPMSSGFLAIKDWSLTPPAVRPGHKVEYTDVEQRRPDSPDFRRLWHVVNATAEWRFVGVSSG